MAASVVRGAELPGKRKCAIASLDLSSLLFLALAVATLATPSAAAVYKVGDSAGWTILGNVNYSAWADSKNFSVGDTLVFEYNKQFHNVEVVSEANYKSCSAQSPKATYTTGNDSIALTSAGHHFFLCGVPGHCTAGQKVDVNVLEGASAPAPAGTAPSPSPGPSSLAPPTPSPAAGGPAVYKVGDSAGWTTLGNVNYSAWAASKTFRVGDTIVFQYNKQFHNVEVVSEADYKSCSARSPKATYTTGKDSIALTRAGHHFFLCGVPGHCTAGQKVDVNVLEGASAPAPAGTAPSASPGLSSSAPPTPSPGAGGPAPPTSRAAPGAAGNYVRGWAVALLAVAVGATLS